MFKQLNVSPIIAAYCLQLSPFDVQLDLYIKVLLDDLLKRLVEPLIFSIYFLKLILRNLDSLLERLNKML